MDAMNELPQLWPQPQNLSLRSKHLPLQGGLARRPEAGVCQAMLTSQQALRPSGLPLKPRLGKDGLRLIIGQNLQLHFKAIVLAFHPVDVASL